MKVVPHEAVGMYRNHIAKPGQFPTFRILYGGRAKASLEKGEKEVVVLIINE